MQGEEKGDEERVFLLPPACYWLETSEGLFLSLASLLLHEAPPPPLPEGAQQTYLSLGHRGRKRRHDDLLDGVGLDIAARRDRRASGDDGSSGGGAGRGGTRGRRAGDGRVHGCGLLKKGGKSARARGKWTRGGREGGEVTKTTTRNCEAGSGDQEGEGGREGKKKRQGDVLFYFCFLFCHPTFLRPLIPPSPAASSHLPPREGERKDRDLFLKKNKARQVLLLLLCCKCFFCGFLKKIFCLFSFWLSCIQARTLLLFLVVFRGSPRAPRIAQRRGHCWMEEAEQQERCWCLRFLLA